MPKKQKQQPKPQPEPDELQKAMQSLESSGEVELPNLDAALSMIDRPQSPIEALPDAGSLEKNYEAEMSETLKAFRAARANERKLFQDTTDSEYWFCVCFQSREQKDAFLAALKLTSLGDKFLDGTKLAKKFNVELPAASPRFIEQETEKRLTKELPTIRKPQG